MQLPLQFLAFDWPTNSAEYFLVDHADGSARNLCFQPFAFHHPATPSRIEVDYNHGMIAEKLKAEVWHTEDSLQGMITFPSSAAAIPFIEASNRGEFNAVSPTHTATDSEDVTAENGETVTVVKSASISAIALVKQSANPNARLWAQGFDFAPGAFRFKDPGFYDVAKRYQAAFFKDKVRAANAYLAVTQTY